MLAQYPVGYSKGRLLYSLEEWAEQTESVELAELVELVQKAGLVELVQKAGLDELVQKDGLDELDELVESGERVVLAESDSLAEWA